MIGAVNTIVYENNNKKIGYNTDWIGIKRPIEKLLKNLNDGYGIVLGAGMSVFKYCFSVLRI